MVVNIINKKSGFTYTYYKVWKLRKLSETVVGLYFEDDLKSQFVDLKDKSIVIQNDLFALDRLSNCCPSVRVVV